MRDTIYIFKKITSLFPLLFFLTFHGSVKGQSFPVTSGTYTVCNNVGLSVCQISNGKMVVFAEEICDNGIDDDLDGLIDCNDPDCTSSGDCDLCYNESPAVEYKINSVEGAVSYTWNLPDGAVITSQPADTFIIVDYSNAMTGVDSVQIIVSDMMCSEDSVSFYQNIIFCNDPPIAHSDSEITDEDVSITIFASDNDTDTNLDPTTINLACSICTTPTNGMITNNGNGSLTYTPNLNYNGTENFIYQICDTDGLCDTSTIDILIQPVADAPIAIDDYATTNENTSVSVDVTNNDSDVDGNLDLATLTILTNATNGNATISAAEINYIPNSNYTGMDSVVYTICDTDGLCDTATLTINVLLDTNDDCDEFLEKPELTFSNPVCETDTIVMFVQNEYLTNISQMDTNDLLFYWFNGNGDTLVIQQESIYSIAANDPLAISPFSVQVTVQGCISPISNPAEVEVVEIPVVTATNNGPICEGDPVQLSAEFFPNATYEWRIEGTTAIISTEREPIFNNVNTTTIYEVTVYVTPCITPGTATTTVEVEALITVAPMANYTLNSDCSPADLTLIANAMSNTTLTFEWNGPNSFISNEENPTIENVDETFNGTYTLTATSPMGCSTTGSVFINNITNSPSQPIINSSGQTCEGGTVTLSIQEYSGNSLSYTWETPNNVTTNIVGLNTNEININPIDISHEGNYIVTVMVDNCTTISDTFNLVLFDEVIVEISATTTPLCEGGNLSLTANSPDATSFEWSGPNGFTSNAQNPIISNVSIANNGTYTLMVTNIEGCQATESINVLNISEKPTTPTITSNSPVCEDGNIHFSLVQQYPSNATISWLNAQGDTIGYGPSLDLATNDLGAISPYTAVVNINNCYSDASEQATVEILPILVITAFNSSPVCEGEDVQLFTTDIPNATYQWFIAGTNTVISNEQNPIITAPNDSTNYIVNVATDYECLVSATAFTTIEIVEDLMVTNLTGGGSYCSGETITLSANISGEGSYTWTGPNGFTENGTTGASAPFTATTTLTGNIASGTYSLKTISTFGCESDLSTLQVDITPALEVPNLVVANAAICEGDMLQLSSSAYNGANVNYNWFFGSSQIATTSSPTHFISNTTPANTGLYSIQAIVDGCESPISNIVSVDIYGVASVIEASNSSTVGVVCEGENVQLALPFMSNATYEWFGPGGYTSNSFNPSLENITADQAGDYFAIISLNGCADIVSTTTTVLVNPTPESPTIVNDGPICEGDTLLMTVSSPLTVPTDSSMTFSWYSATTNQLMGETYEPFFTINNAATSFNGGYYMIVTVDGCPSEPTEITLVEINETPSNNAVAGQDLEICGATFTNLDAEIPTIGTGVWSCSTGATIANPEVPNTEVLDLIFGENIFIWTLSNSACGNYDTDTMIVTVTQSSNDIADAGIDLEVCNINNVTLQAATPITANGTWTQTNDQASQGVIIVDASDPNTQILGLENGNIYTFNWILSEGNCFDFDSDEVVITTYDIPIENAYISIPENIYLCDAEEINLQAVAPTTATGLWTVNSNALIVNAASHNTIAADLAIGENIFVWSLSNGICEHYSSDTIYVYVEDLLEANSEHFNLVINDSLIQVDLLENDFINNVNEWHFSIAKFPENGTLDFEENGVINYIPNQNFFGPDTMIYRLCNVNCPTLCDTTMVTFHITGVGASGECFVPNAMTPDGDGVNDVFTIPCLDTYDDSSLAIFNRWGDEVFRSKPYQNNWDGTYKGKELPAGTYFYILDVKINGNVQKIQGYVTLFR